MPFNMQTTDAGLVLKNFVSIEFCEAPKEGLCAGWKYKVDKIFTLQPLSGKHRDEKFYNQDDGTLKWMSLASWIIE